MLWRIETRLFLPNTNAWRVIRGFPRTNSLQRRRLSTGDQTEEIAPREASWSAHDPQDESNAWTPDIQDAAHKPSSRVSVGHGVSITKRGQLKVISRPDAEKDYRTALIVSAASTNLTRADFTRLLPDEDRLEENGIESPLPRPERKGM